jgi:hypothetical protein
MPGGDRLVQKAIYWYFNVLDDLNPSQSLFNSVFKLTSLKTKITKIMNTHVVNYNKNLNNDLAKAGLSPTRLSFLRTRFEVSAINTTHADGDCFGLVVKPYGKTMADFLINPKTEKSLIEEGKNLYHIAHKSTQAFDIPDEGEETSDIPF